MAKAQEPGKKDSQFVQSTLDFGRKRKQREIPKEQHRGTGAARGHETTRKKQKVEDAAVSDAEEATEDESGGSNDGSVHPFSSQLSLSAKHDAYRHTESAEPVMNIKETTSDIFKSPRNSVLVHSCNCRATWGAGIADQMRKRYPLQYEAHVKVSLKQMKREKSKAAKGLRGTALLIPPTAMLDPAKASDDLKHHHWIACLFTKTEPGGRASHGDTPSAISQYTEKAMNDLLQQIAAKQDSESPPGTIHMPKINSGLFRVPWKRTESMLSRKLEVPEGLPSKDIVIHVRP